MRPIGKPFKKVSKIFLYYYVSTVHWSFIDVVPIYG